MALFRIYLKNVLNQNKKILSACLALNKVSIRQHSCCTDLKTVLEEEIEKERTNITKFRQKFGNETMGEVTVNQIYGGMRGITCMVWETSLLDPEEGIRFRGMAIPECQKILPRAKGSEQPLPESMFWYLATGQIPTAEQTQAISQDWASRACLPEHVVDFLDRVPCTVHPMCQFSCAIALLNENSQFVKAYDSGVNKLDYWKYTYEDAMTLIANLTLISAKIYVNTYKDSCLKAEIDPNKDWSYNYCQMIGINNKEFIELMRLYLAIHCDHEGGNVSAHTAHIVQSALSDPFLSFSAAMNGLAGPLHGLANQEVLRWIKKLQKELGEAPSEADVKKFIKKTLESGVVPGFGHAVLRKTDPRYTCQREFALKHLPNDPLFKIVQILFKLVPRELQKLGKVKNPWPNVDAHSGVLLQYYGLTEMDYYTVLFGVSRSLGLMAQNIWSRALLLPIERPKSITTIELMKKFNYNPNCDN